MPRSVQRFTRRSVVGASFALLTTGCAPGLIGSVPTEEPLPTDTPQPTITPTPPPPPTSTPFPTPTPAPYSVAWQDISPPVSLDFNKPADNYGIVTLAIDLKNFATLYAGSCYQGLWMTSNGGGTWTKVNTGRNHEALDGGRLWTLAIDPVDPRVIYTAAGYGDNGVWKSVNGGADWDRMLTPDIARAFGTDIMFINLNPLNHLQLLAGYHQPPAGQSPVILFSGDGGATWKPLGREVPWGGYEGQQGFFLSNTVYLVTTPGAGYWLSRDAGTSWTQVSKTNSNAYNQIVQTPNSTILSGGSDGLLVSRDGGTTWLGVHPAGGPFEAMIGLDDLLFTAPAIAGDKTGTPYFVSPLTDGFRWRPQTTQRFPNGPNRLAADPQRHILYSANGNSGVWKLALRH